MGMFRRLLLTLSLVGIAIPAYAAPDQTMSVSPAAVSGQTITAADENTRNTTISTTFNAHDHNDIDQTANSLNVGDGTAGDKSVCANAADASDLCIKFDDSEDLWVAQQGSSTYASLAIVSAAVGTLNINDVTFTRANTYTIGDGTSGNKLFAVNDDQASSPALRFNTTDDDWEYSDDGSTFADLGDVTFASSYVIKGWIDFNETGSGTINGSYNVTSITDGGTGVWTVTWDTDFADANYSAVATSNSFQTRIQAGKAAGSLIVETSDSSGSATDATAVYVIAVGTQ